MAILPGLRSVLSGCAKLLHFISFLCLHLMASNFETDARLILSDARGIYIPRDFCDGMDADDAARIGVDFTDILTCQAGPDHSNYWFAWDLILGSASVTDANGRVWRLYQNGDLWEIPDDCEIPDYF